MPAARARAYALLADLVARGVTDRNREAARLSPAMAAALDRYADPDAAAVDHHHVFGDSVFPVEGAFLDPHGQVGGAPARTLEVLYRQCGFAPDPRAEPAEHLATELRALASLAAAEAGGDPDAAGHARALLLEHLLRWLPPLAIAVRRLDRPWPTALVDQIEELALYHLGQTSPHPRPLPRFAGEGSAPPGAGVNTPPPLAGEVAPPEDGLDKPPPLAGEGQGGGAREARGWSLPELPDLLADPAVSLRRIAAVLATPALAGVFLSSPDLAAIGRRLSLPRGFGSRVDLLENLLHAAARFDATSALFDEVGARVTATRDALASSRYEHRDVISVLQPWRDRCDRTLALLRDLDSAVRAIAEEPE